MLKVKNIYDLKTNFSFEAPVFSASIPKRKSANDTDSIGSLDLNSYLAPKPDTCFLVKVNGTSMIDERIYSGDILVVDSKEAPSDGKIVIAALNGEMAVKKFRIIDDHIYLISANKEFMPIEIGPYMQFEIQGVVKHVIHNV